MRRALLALLVAPLLAAEPSSWHTDLDHAFTLAKKLDQPLFVVLSCPH
jgi:hypothetical protein